MTLADVSRETRERLDIFSRLLRQWNPKINLVSPSTLEKLEDRHIEDSLQLLPLAPEACRTWADLGSGGGLPGLVIALARPTELDVTLVESDMRKASFMRHVLRETGVEAEVVNERIEKAEPIGADVISARALAPLNLLLAYVDRHLRAGGTALLLKGASYEEEMREALAKWRFDCDTYPSSTDPRSVILKIGDISRV